MAAYGAQKDGPGWESGLAQPGPPIWAGEAWRGLNAKVRWLHPATCQTQPRQAATGSATTICFKTPTLSLSLYISSPTLTHTHARTHTHTLSKIITMNDDETESEGEIRASVEPASEDAPSSPGSSGYVGEGGSTSATTGSQFEIEHEEIEEDTTIDMDRISISDSHASWIPGKRHFDEVCALVLVGALALRWSMPISAVFCLLIDYSAGWWFHIVEEEEETFLRSQSFRQTYIFQVSVCFTFSGPQFALVISRQGTTFILCAGQVDPWNLSDRKLV